ncbi:energy transducer TonB family protein [Avibacterium gallinarum]|uniref:energy transducer TonB family protein n=1 Tax=Avibacterium gallinarum TaxID=755 RepID=UPI0039FDA4E0
MANKHRSWFGFFFSLLFHATVIGAIVYAVKADSSANGYQADVIDNSISMEMLMGMTVEEPEPAPEPVAEPEPEPVAKEIVPDPIVKPEPPKPEKPKEIKKEKPKEKKKEKTKKEKPLANKALEKGDRNVNSEAKITATATSLGKATVNNPNLVSKSAGSDVKNAYMGALRREIERHRRYPQRAKMMRKQGVATVSFNIAADGSLSNIQLVKSSGNNDLDKAALEAVNRTKSIGARPAGLSPSMTVPIRFSIQ